MGMTETSRKATTAGACWAANRGGPKALNNRNAAEISAAVGLGLTGCRGGITSKDISGRPPRLPQSDGHGRGGLHVFLFLNSPPTEPGQSVHDHNRRRAIAE